ncbi:smr domain-containing protein [Phlyctema vagabunda]|uniref:Smr domain-containing protein n=1 Tax=Phlyctema vagabunda TaxID=108571 RepID=A0ABR4PZ82_9HELO
MSPNSIPMTRLGGNAFNHSSSNDAEAEYDRLRDLARAEATKRGACFDKAHQAYERGDGAAAHDFSEEGKQHAANMDRYNKQASDFIFRENNEQGRVPDDTIDLHGQFVQEAEDILEQRIRYAQQQGQSHLHVIVGKGNHSVNHVQKIKPRVEQVCQELGLKYATEENAGVIYVNLQGGEAVIPPANSHGGQQQQHGGNQQHGGQQHGGQQHGGQQHAGQQHGGQQQHGGYPGQQQGGQQHGNNNNNNNNQNDELEKLAKKLVPRIMKKLDGCCVVM